MFRLPDAARRFLLGLTLVAVPLSAIAAAAGAQTRKTSTNARPTPVNVPRLPQRATPTPTPSIINVPTSQDDAPPPPPPPRPTPTPKPTPKPKPVEETLDDTDVVRVTSNLVVVPVAVTDAGGNAVQGLKKEDFLLEEEGRGQELQAVGTADEVPLDIALLIDASSSVKERFDFEKSAAANFLKSVLKPGDRAAVFAIESKPRLVQALASADVASGSLLTIPPPQPEKSFTAFFDTVRLAADYLDKNAPGRHRRVIVALTDGDDTARILSAGRPGSIEKQLDLVRGAQQEVLREVQRADAVFYSINPSGNTMHLNVRTARAQEGMELIAGSTGGSAFVPEFEGRLEAIFRQVAAELRAQYLLQYLSNNQAATGKFLRIKVSTPARPDTRIRARQGYFKKG